MSGQQPIPTNPGQPEVLQARIAALDAAARIAAEARGNGARVSTADVIEAAERYERWLWRGVTLSQSGRARP